MKRERTIPTILGLVLLAITAIGTGTVAIRSGTSGSVSANLACDPKDIKVTNLTPQSADISFTTTNQCLTQLKLGSRIFDDSRGAGTKRRLHYFQASGLSSSTEYSIEVIADGQTKVSDQRVMTLAGSSIKTDGSRLSWGKVLTSDLKPAAGSVLYIDIPGAQPLSAFVSDLGNWVILSTNAYAKSGNSLFSYPPTAQPETITVVEQDGKSTEISNTTDNNQPVPDIILGQPGFTLPKYSSSQSAVTPQGSLGNQTQQSATTKLTIQYPSSGEKIGNPKPEFFGKSQAGSSVDVELSGLQSEKKSIISTNLGEWKYSPSTSLIPGSYSLKVTSGSESLSSPFTIASDESLAFVSTPSAVTEVPIPSPTVQPSIPTPTLTLPTPSLAPIISPTAIPTQVVSTPTTTPKDLPKSGSFGATGLLLGLGFLLSVAGGLLLQR